MSILFVGFWFLGFLLDAKITVKNSQLIPKRELNVIFPTLCSRFGPKRSCFIYFTIELMAVTFLPVLFIHTFDVAASSVTAVVFGASHLLAFHSNKKITTQVR
jgi:hypothetical protein